MTQRAWLATGKALRMSEVLHDTKAAIDFLQKWRPEGPWVLTAIIPDGAIETATFPARKWNTASNWIESYQGKRNLYFHVNPVRRDLSSKATKEDVARLGWLHVDIDPRAGEDHEEERARALRMLETFVPRPSVIVDSGGGFQGFWRLQEAARLEIDGNVRKAEELEAYNIQLEKLFGSDHCHNVDRIMRLPGTINLPNAKKLKKRRVPALARCVSFLSTTYPITDFVPAVRVQAPEQRPGGEPMLSGGRPRVQISSGNLPDMGVTEIREWARLNHKLITDNTLAIIATGKDPIDEHKYPSRSEALFKVCCDLVRADVPDDIIFAIITGSNEIATSVKEKKGWEAYALRQIERAREEAVDPWLRRLNEKHAVISDIGGRCRIISEIADSTLPGRTRISRQSFEDFRNRYRHEKVAVGVSKGGQEILQPVGAWWIDHPQRRQYETIVFVPGQDVPGAYNLWAGFACDSLPGTKHERFLSHVRENICDGNPEHYNYLIQWMARCVQHPDSPGEVAVVLRGKRGTGKSFFAKVMRNLFGRHFLQVSDSKHLVGSFNAHLRDTVILFGDEAFFAGDKRHESILKTLVTEEQMVIEGKGLDAEVAPNYVHLILASNEDWVVPAGLDERRFFVLEIGEKHKQDHNYFKTIFEDLAGGGYENLLHFLLSRDLAEYEVRQVPQTKALQDQKMLSMNPEVQWLFEHLWDGRLLPEHNSWERSVLKDLLYEHYLKTVKDLGVPRRLGRTSWGRFLFGAFPPGSLRPSQEMAEVPITNEHGFQITIRKRAYVYHVPTLEDTRKHWDRNFGGPYEWPVPDLVPAEPNDSPFKPNSPF